MGQCELARTCVHERSSTHTMGWIVVCIVCLPRRCVVLRFLGANMTVRTHNYRARWARDRCFANPPPRSAVYRSQSTGLYPCFGLLNLASTQLPRLRH